MALYAGLAADVQHDPEGTGARGAGRDDEEARELLAQHSDLSEAECRQRANDLVAKHWPEIEALATELLEAKTLTGEEQDMICDAIAEGLDWRAELSKYRVQWGKFLRDN